MAACSLGASSLKIRNLDFGFGGSRLNRLPGIKTKSLIGFSGLVTAPNAKKSLLRWGCFASNAQWAAGATSRIYSDLNWTVPSKTTFTSNSASPRLDESLQKFILSDAASAPIQISDEVESFLTELCDTTTIAEVELKVGDFKLYVMRNLKSQPSTSLPPPIPASEDGSTAVELANSNGSAPSPCLSIVKLDSSDEVGTSIVKAADEGLVIIRSPKVGIFKRSRTIRGRLARPSCQEKQQVKEGQIICYIDQASWEVPVECTVAGEVTKILLKDGDFVAYGDPIMEILPSFHGI
ncbi:hypothetical protein DM860_010131 [Cuscuta australis]|uniref:Lipoyl-binding domain-containing protein n=1 Tax=Cuscuta australis TaxID=267555 RepID=A0A328D699_9ASTE|nr:hypothetical protein DM860_010131 [Cuscuta australis]